LSTELLRRLRSVDPSIWILALAILVRLDVALRFDPGFGYDAPSHMAYADLIGQGRFPRVGDTDLGGARTTSPHPPLFYALAFIFGKLGFGRGGGTAVSLIAGIIRLLLADRLMRRFLSPRARLFANVVHGFIPFTVRIDVFYSNEALGTTLSLTAIALALARRPVLTGIALGAAFLTKATAVAAVPAVIAAFFLEDGLRAALTLPRFKQLAIAGALSAAILAPWSYGNVVRHGRPYVSAYHPTIMSEAGTHPHLFTAPFYKKHKPEWYFPRLRYKDLAFPYCDNNPTLYNALYLEAWGDYYNYLRPKRGGPQIANANPIAPEIKRTHIAFVHVGLAFLVALIAGFIETIRRVRRRDITLTETVVAALGLGYLFIAVSFATWVPLDYHGAVKSSYALASVVILSAWTARGLELAARGRALTIAVGLLVATPIVFTLWQRIVW
jgi:hypothetical protein